MSAKRPQPMSAAAIDAAWRNLTVAAADRSARSDTIKERLATERREEKKIDRRTLRKTGRTQQVNIRLRQATRDDIQRLSETHGWLIGEVIEHAIEALKAQMQR